MSNVDALPVVQSKEITSFQEFNLSKVKPNNAEKENAPVTEDHGFKARPFDKKIVEEPFKPSLLNSNRKIETSPFNFSTIDRAGRSSIKKRDN